MFSVKDEKWQGENTRVLTNKKEPIYVSVGCEKKNDAIFGAAHKKKFPS